MTNSNPPSLQPLVDAMKHPVRGKMLLYLLQEPAGVEEIAARLDESAGKIRYHLRALIEEDLVSVVDEEPRRGVVKRYYAGMRWKTFVGDEEYAKLSQAEKVRLDSLTLKEMLADISASMRSGVCFERPDSHLTFVRGEVDEKGWKDLAAIHLRAFFEVENVRVESKDRLNGEKAELIPFSAFSLMFERDTVD
ncbi:MAG TPA: winged helix-turn-helix domain-containing protein [Solirubrobacterales bacterium]